MRITEIENPKPGPGEILAKVLHCGICATDVSIVNGTLNLGKGNEPVYPVRIGHEWSGQVVELGAALNVLKQGTGLSAIPDIPAVNVNTACGGTSDPV